MHLDSLQDKCPATQREVAQLNLGIAVATWLATGLTHTDLLDPNHTEAPSGPREPKPPPSARLSAF
jgi:hypothetical protein